MEATMHPLQSNGGNDYTTESPFTTASSLFDTRLAELKSFYIALRSPVLQNQVEEDEIFTNIIQLAIDDYGVGQGELAGIIQTQNSTVGRWRQGTSVPSVYARPGVLAAIASAVSQHIDEREKNNSLT
jgi:hypothetical protein